MARPQLKLPTDDEARAIAAGVALIDVPELGNRDFLGQFIGLVKDATGQFFNAHRYRALLKAYAPTRRPSTTTIQDAIRASRIAEVLPCVVSAPQVPQRAPTQALRPVNHDFSAIRVLEAELSHHRERARQLQDENRRLIASLATASARLEALQAEFQAAEARTATASSRSADLVAAVAAATKEASGARAFAMQAIDNARTETRQVKEQRDKALADVQREREMNVLLRTELQNRRVAR
jgi:hypothetical protein